MCFGCLCSCFSWILDAIQRILTTALFCWLMMVVCCGLFIAASAGVAFGYHYSISEFLNMNADIKGYYKIMRELPDEPYDADNFLKKIQQISDDDTTPESQYKTQNVEELWVKAGYPKITALTHDYTQMADIRRWPTTWFTETQTESELLNSNPSVYMRKFEPITEDELANDMRRIKPTVQKISDDIRDSKLAQILFENNLRKTMALENISQKYTRIYDQITQKMSIKDLNDYEQIVKQMSEQKMRNMERILKNDIRKIEPIGEVMLENIPKATEAYDDETYKTYNPDKYRVIGLQTSSFDTEADLSVQGISERNQINIAIQEFSTEGDENDPYRPV